MANPYNEPGRPVNGFNHINGQQENSPVLQHSSGISMEWTPDEQTILEENLARYASETNIVRYAKIAVLLHNKTVRDVALRCRWMNKKENSKRRKEDQSLLRKNNNRKENMADPSSRPALLAGGPTRKLLWQNGQVLEQISANFRSYQMHENIGLFYQARDNILQILNNLRDTQDVMKQMPPFPEELNEELANLVLPRRTFPKETMSHNHHCMP
ncbi:Histone H2A deubiquitinase [Heracleum sosnowskyi]|uniref:Histone H2A deubiquitinase n=1 Tax=Heracleum sosnowskyi TaxID=360622 RepID=A0AAD8I5A2_9APIA|nr:Histone H2A deubiquitinase [Heracleum sosnowskyi]KAK1379356.1 Histone H2A deubiquitinase [Heracleum sosnowskyi]